MTTTLPVATSGIGGRRTGRSRRPDRGPPGDRRLTTGGAGSIPVRLLSAVFAATLAGSLGAGRLDAWQTAQRAGAGVGAAGAGRAAAAAARWPPPRRPMPDRAAPDDRIRPYAPGTDSRPAPWRGDDLHLRRGRRRPAGGDPGQGRARAGQRRRPRRRSGRRRRARPGDPPGQPRRAGRRGIGGWTLGAGNRPRHPRRPLCRLHLVLSAWCWPAASPVLPIRRRGSASPRCSGRNGGSPRSTTPCAPTQVLAADVLRHFLENGGSRRRSWSRPAAHAADRVYLFDGLELERLGLAEGWRGGSGFGARYPRLPV